MTESPTIKRRRRVNGDGSVYKRSDGYWVGAFYARTTSGARKRVVVYGKTLAEARDKLGHAQHQARAGIPVPDESWKVGRYLEYWLENIVKRNRRPATYALYETIIRLYLVPGLGARAWPGCQFRPCRCSSTSAWRLVTRSARCRSCARCSAPPCPGRSARN